MKAEAEQSAGVALKTRKAESREGGAVRTRVLRDLRLALAAIWLGSAVLFSATVAPSAFGILRARNVPHANEAAGSIVTSVLSVVNTSGFVIALLLFASAFLVRRSTSRRAFNLEIISTLVVAIATGVGQWVIAARMLSLRAAMGRPIDEVAVEDPLRNSFNTLHGYSVTALGVAIIAAGVLLLIISRRSSR